MPRLLCQSSVVYVVVYNCGHKEQNNQYFCLLLDQWMSTTAAAGMALVFTCLV